MSTIRERLVRLPTAVMLALAVAVAALVGVVGGGTMARWRDVERVSASMPAGLVMFGVSSPATSTAPATAPDYASGSGDTVEITFDKEAASTLYTTGSVALPVKVDALSQGHRGLRYTIARQIVPNGVFADSAIRLVKVTSAAACQPGVAGAEVTESTPVDATYSTTTTPTTEYLCLVATFERVQGTYENNASASVAIPGLGGDPAGRLTAEDSWSAQVLKPLDPAKEGTHRLVFSFTTFRPAR